MVSHFAIGYMLLFLTVLQMLALFCTHLLMTRTAASILTMLCILAITSVGGYIVHIGEIPSYLWWSEALSPQRWLLPVIVAEEFSQKTLSNTAGQQLCRNKHVSCHFACINTIDINCFLFTGSTPRNHRLTSLSSAKRHAGAS